MALLESGKLILGDGQCIYEPDMLFLDCISSSGGKVSVRSDGQTAAQLRYMEFLFSAIDGGDGTVNAIEFVTALERNPTIRSYLRLEEKTSRQTLLDAFEAMDTDGDGRLSWDEFYDHITDMNVQIDDACEMPNYSYQPWKLGSEASLERRALQTAVESFCELQERPTNVHLHNRNLTLLCALSRTRMLDSEIVMVIGDEFCQYEAVTRFASHAFAAEVHSWSSGCGLPMQDFVQKLIIRARRMEPKCFAVFNLQDARASDVMFLRDALRSVNCHDIFAERGVRQDSQIQEDWIRVLLENVTMVVLVGSSNEKAQGCLSSCSGSVLRMKAMEISDLHNACMQNLAQCSDSLPDDAANSEEDFSCILLEMHQIVRDVKTDRSQYCGGYDNFSQLVKHFVKSVKRLDAERKYISSSIETAMSCNDAHTLASGTLQEKIEDFKAGEQSLSQKIEAIQDQLRNEEQKENELLKTLSSQKDALDEVLFEQEMLSSYTCFNASMHMVSLRGI